MKTPEEYLEQHFDEYDVRISDLKEMILATQKESYNETIKDVENNIECEIIKSNGFEYPTVKWSSIDKLKK